MNAKEKENESYVWWMCGETISMLKIRKEIECYDKVMERRPNYPKIWYNLGLGYKQKAKEYVHKSEAINKIRRKIKWKKMLLLIYQIIWLCLSEKLNAQERKRENKNQID